MQLLTVASLSPVAFNLLSPFSSIACLCDPKLVKVWQCRLVGPRSHFGHSSQSSTFRAEAVIKRSWMLLLIMIMISITQVDFVEL